jgi:anti-repressor protein
MQELIIVNQGTIGNEVVQTVNARDLHAFLEVGKDFSNWIKKRIEQYGFIEGTDYVLAQTGENSTGGRPAIEYHITLAMGKELSMVERNAKGKEARTYFIACEARAKSPVQVDTPELQIAHAILLAGKLIETQKLQIAEMQPKADFFDAVAGSPTAVDMAIVAKTLNMGIGRNRLFDLLREKGILDRHNIPYQQYCGRGYFRVVESQYDKPDGTSCVSFKTVVFQKGMDYIRKILAHSELEAA